MDCVIILSVINFKNRKLSYSDTRSMFSPAQRLEQSKKTISSVREGIPGCRIMFFELGTEDFGEEVRQLADDYIFFGEKKIVRLAADSQFKGLGEAVGLIYASRILPKTADRFFKISGRYFLNKDFRVSDWNKEGIIVLRDSWGLSTRFYSFSRRYRWAWLASLVLSIPLLILNVSLEKAMFIFLPKRICSFVSKIGISGQVAVDANMINE